MQLHVAGQSAGELPLAGLLNDPLLNPHRVQIPARSVIYEPADPARNIYYVQAGQVRTYHMGPNGSRRLVELLGPGGWCGAAALAGLECYDEAAETAVATSLVIVAAERLFARLPSAPTSASELIRQLAAKLTVYRQDAAGLVFEDCHNRLLRTLIDLSGSAAASPTADGVVVRITHLQLAQKVGVARETVSLALAHLRRRNLLRTGRNQLTFRPQDLRSAREVSATMAADDIVAGQ